MPFLAMTYYLGCPKEKFSKVILFAILFGYLGDILLLIEGLFLLGVVSFLVGHLLYTVTFFVETGLKNYRKNLLVFLLVCVVYFYIETEVLGYFRPALVKFGLWGPLFVYTSILSALNISSALYAYCYRNIYSILAYIGSIIFYVSDCILAKQLFFEYNKYYQISIMFTYILGQSLISLGMANKMNSFELGIINDSLKKMI
jgi:uncharacterized membrane protein YhhN